ncbi:hypothetical protein ACFWPX_36295 [Nocardia sp. NPDC058518]|uniref:hypothetical protein n=1 Tax=Nocardia sp. NPDC058518 TaxID=3346534 RepID=UPI0036583910
MGNVLMSVDPVFAAALNEAQDRTGLELVCVRGRLDLTDEHTVDELALFLDEARAAINAAN